MTPPPAHRAFSVEGVVVFGHDERTARWAAAARAVARPRIAEAARSGDLRCGATWLAGVGLLPNAPDGAVAGVPLAGPAFEAVAELGLAPEAWHAAQISVTWPGYPRPGEGESPGAARYRLRRDAAHVDGLLPEGTPRRRHLREPHAFILGLPLTDSDAEASPLVVWPGSHRLIGAALDRALAEARAEHPDLQPGDVDLTDAYTAARRAAFEACPRVPLPLRPGQAVLMHRRLLHGIAPWRARRAGDEGRAMAYFRPELGSSELWFGDGGGGGPPGGARPW